MFVHFNLFFSKYVSSRKDPQLTDSLLDEEDLFPKGTVLQILRVLAIIFENCQNKGSFSGLEVLTMYSKHLFFKLLPLTYCLLSFFIGFGVFCATLITFKVVCFM